MSKYNKYNKALEQCLTHSKHHLIVTFVVAYNSCISVVVEVMLSVQEKDKYREGEKARGKPREGLAVMRKGREGGGSQLMCSLAFLHGNKLSE